MQNNLKHLCYVICYVIWYMFHEFLTRLEQSFVFHDSVRVTKKNVEVEKKISGFGSHCVKGGKHPPDYGRKKSLHS